MGDEVPGLVCWVDASAGVAGDMLLGALLDAGASLAAVRAAVDAVAPALVEISTEQVVRHGMRATKAHVRPLAEPHHHEPVAGTVPAPHHHRAWRDIDRMLAGAGLPGPVERLARDTFSRIAVAEGRAHGVDPAEVHFHEVGAWDSIADVVGVSAALHDLGVTRLLVGEVAVGSGTIRMAHGELAVPGPAVAEMARGLRVQSGPARTELATPTGIAFLAGAEQVDGLPPLQVTGHGTGAGTKDFAHHANIVRVVLGRPAAAGPTSGEPLTLLECNVDDLDPRLWPGVVQALLDAGARDAWLTPILMKKGRPAHTLHVLSDDAPAHRELVFQLTSTLGVRELVVQRTALERRWATVDVDGRPVRVKLGHRGGWIVTVQPEFADVAGLAQARGCSELAALHLAQAAALHDDLAVGRPVPGPGD